jgi:hypothetical protein
MFRIARQKAGIPQTGTELSTVAFRRPEPPTLFAI